MFAAITAYTAAARKVDRPAAWLMSPYLAWVAFATLLNAEIVRLND
jgi:tryptophan-rich sensory protein